jgi:hypothetical protein|tara:strand:+ start:24 stop:653 length:630 start_codon:yes stop_codon:yes gene_type:complete
MSDNKTIKINLKINKMSKKFKFQLRGTEFQLPLSQVREDNYNNNEKYIYMNAKSCASVIKQYVKKTYPTLKVWATSDVYSGGSSVRVNVSNSDGSPITDQKIWEDISSWKYTLQGGTFNGMIDMYETREDSVSTQSGTPLKYFPSYVFVENKPKWDSIEYWVSQWKEYQNSLDSEWTEKVQRLGGWLEYNKEFMNKKNIDKVASLTVNA